MLTGSSTYVKGVLCSPVRFLFSFLEVGHQVVWILADRVTDLEKADKRRLEIKPALEGTKSAERS
jgi:hypothetical protein